MIPSNPLWVQSGPQLMELNYLLEINNMHKKESTKKAYSKYNIFTHCKLELVNTI